MSPRSRYTSLAKAKPPTDTRSCWHLSKATIRLLSIIFSAAVIGVTVHTTVKYLNDFDWIPDLIYFTVPISGFLIIWNLAEFITACARKGRGIHPGAHVAVQLLAWLALGIDAGLVLHAAWRLDQSDLVEYREFDWYRVALKACTGLLAVLCVLHFILFVAACIDTHHRRNWWKKQILLKTTEKGIADESAVHLVGSAAMAPPMPYDGGYSAFPAPSGNTRAAATPGPAASH